MTTDVSPTNSSTSLPKTKRGDRDLSQTLAGRATKYQPKMTLQPRVKEVSAH